MNFYFLRRRELKKKNVIIISIIILLSGIILLLSCQILSKNILTKSFTNPEPVIDPYRFVNIAQLQGELHTIAKSETPSVVSISTETIISQPFNFFDPFDFFFNEPMDPWNDDQKSRKQKKKEFKQGGLGSGVIYKKKGNIYYIVTNNHVIDGVDSIKVSIDQSKSYDGEIIAGDPAVDIAVIKVKTKDKLEVAKFGDSNSIKTGDFVVAIGNPFGLQGTMTFGIISALGRGDITPGKVNLTNFIQTDAAINPGNSGGPLINLQGEVIGINTLIYSRSGGNVGIGFAIPVNIAKEIADQIIENGKVEHGYLGIEFESLDKEKIDMLDLGNIDSGMHVLNVFENSPADKYGLKPGDVLMELNGKKLSKTGDFTIAIGNSKPGTKIDLKILRDGKVIEKEVILGDRSDMKTSKAEIKSESEIIEKYGFVLSEITESLRKQFKIPPDIAGIVITNLDPRGVAVRVGLQKGDVITKINNKKVNSVKEVKDLLKDNDEESYFFMNRKGKEFIVKM